MTTRIMTIVLGIAASMNLLAESATTVFRGRPMVKVTEMGVSRNAEILDRDQTAGFECVVSRIGTTYYWASRENKVLTRHDGEGYVTYVAAGGAGYVKIVKAQTKTTLKSRFSSEQLEAVPEGSFDYVEHMPIGLGNITYYGISRVGGN